MERFVTGQLRPPTIQEMTDFENDLQQITRNIEFTQISSSFQEKPKNDMEHIKKSNQICSFCRQIKKYIQSRT